VVSGNNIDLTAEQGSIKVGSGTEQFVQSMNDINMQAKVSINNSGNVVASNNLTVDTNNTTGTLSITNTGTMQSGGTLSIGGYNGGTNATLSNSGSGLIYGYSLNLKTSSINNSSDANILAEHSSDITTTTLSNSGMLTLSMTNSDIKSTLNADSVNNSGTIQSAEDMKIVSNTLSNSANANIISDGSLELVPESSLQITNATGARIEGVGVTINADSLTNDSSAVISSDNGLNITSNSISNSGTIQNKSGSMSVNVNGDFTNSGWTSLLINEGGSSTLDVSGTLHNEGAIHGNGNFTITANTLGNTGTAGISSLATLDLTTSSDFTNDGALYAGSLLKLTATDKSVTNNGTMDSSGNIEVNSDNFYNISSESNTETGKVRAAGDITFNLSGEFKNKTGGASADPPHTRTDYSPMTQAEFEAYDQSGTAGTHDVKFYSGSSTGTGGYSLPFYTVYNSSFDDWGSPDTRDSDGTDYIELLYDPDGEPWSVYRFYRRRWDDGDLISPDVAHKFEFVKGVHQNDHFEYPLFSNKAQITAGGTLNINFGNGGENRGGVLSADVINISGTGDFTNNALKNQVTHYEKFYNFSFAIFEDGFDGHDRWYERWVRYPGIISGIGDGGRKNFSMDWTTQDWQNNGWTENYKQVTWNTDTSTDDADIIQWEDKAISKFKEVSTDYYDSGNGAGVFANAFYVDITGNFNNIGSTSDVDPDTHEAQPDGNPTGSSPDSRTMTGVNGASTTDVSVNNNFSSGVNGTSFNGIISGTDSSAGLNGTNFGSSLSGIGINITLPQNPNGYFVQSRDPNARYLVEVNPRFGLDSATYLDSEYLFSRLNLQDDINRNIIRLGDAYYENYLIQQQLIQLTGRPILSRYQQNAQLQIQGLFDNAVKAAGDLNLVWGVELTKE
jgi:adhesin HecA-like repeat protein